MDNFKIGIISKNLTKQRITGDNHNFGGIDYHKVGKATDKTYFISFTG
jgi:hypothetical protein